MLVLLYVVLPTFVQCWGGERRERIARAEQHLVVLGQSARLLCVQRRHMTIGTPPGRRAIPRMMLNPIFLFWFDILGSDPDSMI